MTPEFEAAEATPRDSRRILTGLRYAFVATLLIGTAGIAFGTWWSFDVITIALPLAAMAGYLIAGYLIDDANLATTQFADSVYYVGFLFTLVALTASLVALSGEDDFDIQGIIARFGVALVTTVVGLGVRIYLVNFRGSAEDSVERLEDSLIEAADRLRQRLESQATQYEAQQAVVHQAFRRLVERANDDLTVSLTTTRKALSAAAADLAAASGKVAGEVERSGSAAIGEFKQDVEAASEALSTRLNDVVQALGQARIPPDLLSSQVQPALALLNQSILGAGEGFEEALDAHRESVQQAQQLTAALRETVQRIRGVQVPSSPFAQLGTSVGELNAELETAARSLGGIASSLQQQVEAIAREKQDLDGLRDSLDATLAAIGTYRTTLEGELAASTDAYKKVHDELVAGVRFLTSELDG